MLNASTKIVLFLIVIAILISCNAVKHVPDGQLLLEKNTVIVNDKKETSPDVLSYLQQRPNQKILGVPFSLHLYNWGNPDTTAALWPETAPKFSKWFSKNFSDKQYNALKRSMIGLNRWKLKSGNPPVISDTNKIDRSVEALKGYYFFNGYRDVAVDQSQKKVDSQRVHVTYNVKTGDPYFIDSLFTSISTPILDSIYSLHKKKSFIKTEQQFRSVNFEKEEDRLISLFRNSGIYKFGENNINFTVDTSKAGEKLYDVLLKIPNRKVSVNDSIIELPYTVQKINNVNVYTDFSFQTKDAQIKDSATYKGINFYSTQKLKHNPKYLYNAVIVEPGSIYRDNDRDLTRKYLRELENFKPSIDIKYEENEDESLNANIYLSPLEKYSLAWDADFTTSNNKPFGILGKFSFLNRNVFRGAEIFELSFQGSFFNTALGASDNETFLNALEIGSTASLKIPRILFPLNTENIIPKRMNPKTNISFALGFQENFGLDRTNITGSLDYNWQSSLRSNHKIELLNLQYINNRNDNNYFNVYQSELEKLNRIAFDINDAEFNIISPPENAITTDDKGKVTLIPLEYINYVLDAENEFAITQPREYAFINNVKEQREILIEDVLVPVTSYAYSFNNRENFKDNSFSTFTGRLISSGNLTTAFIKNTDEDGRKVLFGLPVAQYVKTEIEYKRYWAINQNSSLVFRNFIGAAIPFGNSQEIPFSRSYRAGGSNDIRAWRTFDLGPGSEESTLEFNVGSLKLTTNLEYRFNLFNSLNGALFVDAGNIWDISKTGLASSEAKFKGFNSVKDIAVGTGFGARYDFSFLIFRLDLGFKTYEPYLTSESKWFKNYNFKNSILNIGINYPF